MSVLKRITALILVACMIAGFLMVSANAASAAGSQNAAAASANEDFIRVFHLDAGRKYFTVTQVKEIIDALSAAGYTHLELVVGNEGLRFLLDDMSVTVGKTTYSSEKVAAGIKAGNKAYSHAGEWSQSEMDEMIRYAASRHIGIIPMVNTPGHMNTILDAAEYVGISSPAYSAKISSGWWGSTSTKTSATTVNLSNSSAVAFTQALVKKYVDYFAARGSEYFNLGADEYAADVHSSGSMGFGVMQSGGWYDDYVNYINQVAAIIKAAGMKPIAFNDGIYFNQNDDTAFDKDIIIAYWIPAWGTYYVASPAYLASKGHKILNTNDDWYYVIGRTTDGYGYNNAYNGVNNTPVTRVADGTTMSTDKLVGSMNCVWCDEPNANYESNKSNVMYFIQTLAAKNPDYFVVYTAPEHVWETVTVEATCTQNGSVTTSCTVCGETTVEEIPALGHDYRAVVTAPSCTEDGYTVYTCAVCADSYTADAVAAPGHNYETVTVEATCNQSGSVTTTCTLCGETTVEEIPALGHDYKAVVTAPTCTENGHTTYTCACGDSYTADETEALGHSYEAVTVEADCENAGYTVYTCAACADSYTVDYVEALGHAYETVTEEASCETAGFTTSTCTVCGKTSTEEIPALGHVYESVTVEATCETAGYASGICTACGDSVSEEIPPLGHAWETVTEDATCEQNGSVTTTCTVCGKTSTEEIPALGHSYEKTVIAPTCMGHGYTIYTCAVCDDSYAADEVAAPGHKYEETVVAPTCTEAGYTVGTCVCGDSYTVDEVEALGHSHKAAVIAPTCTENGYTTYTCVCGDSYTADETAALGHSYTSVESDGTVTYTCDHCGDTYTETVNWIALTGTYVLDTDGIDTGAEHKYIVVGANKDYALTLSGSTIGAQKVVVDGNTITLKDGSAYEFYFANNNSKEKSSYLLTRDGSKGVYHMGGNLYYGADNKGYWHFGSSSNGSYQLYDTDNQKWYLNYGYVWASDSANRFAVSSNARSVRLFKATEGYARPSGDVNQTWTHGPETTEAAVLEKLLIQTSTDGTTVSGTAAVTAAMITWDKTFDGSTAGTYTATVTYEGVQIGTVTVTVTGEHTYDAVTVEPTCTEQGFTVHTCTECGVTYTDSYVNSLGHSYTVEETKTQRVYTCASCGHSYTESIAPSYSYDKVTAFTSGKNYVITLYSGNKYYALTHANNTISVVQVTVSNNKITSEITEDMLWNYSGSKLSYESNGTVRYLYVQSSGWGWFSSVSLTLSTTNSSAVSISSSKLKVGTYYLRYSGGKVSLNSSATTTYLFQQKEQ